MADISEATCELRIQGGWQPITLDDAMRLSIHRVTRCPICHGRVRANNGNGAVAHFEHIELHLGCYLVDAFDGNPRPHPKALK